MGSGSYSYTSAVNRSSLNDYSSKSVHEVFQSRRLENAMNPKGIQFRESRDSEEHPNSLAIVIGLDVTGSMGTVPHHLLAEGLPNLMKAIMEAGIDDPQVLFTAIGDHKCDDAPLQVGQFESSDELLEKWLKQVYVEGGGGGNSGESYALAWYFAANHTEIDCFDKRDQKGFLFTIGDEPVHTQIPKNVLKQIMGTGEVSDFTASELLEKAQQRYHVYHIHISETGTGNRYGAIGKWREIIGENLLIVNSYADVHKIIAKTIISNMDIKNSIFDDITKDINHDTEPSKTEEIIL